MHQKHLPSHHTALEARERFGILSFDLMASSCDVLT